MSSNKTFNEISIGDSASLERTLTKRDVDMFAVISGDMNPTHLSDEYARTLLARDKVSGHSMWAGTLVSSLLGNDLPGPGTVYRAQHFDFRGALNLDDTVKVTVTVKEKIAKEKIIIFDCLAVNQNGEPIITGTAEVVAPAVKATGNGVTLDELKYHSRHVFHDLIEKVRDYDPIPMAVAHPCSKTALKGAIDAARASIVTPILVGPRAKLEMIAEELGLDLSPYEIVDTPHSHA